jgi:hypothetical protein
MCGEFKNLINSLLPSTILTLCWRLLAESTEVSNTFKRERNKEKKKYKKKEREKKECYLPPLRHWLRIYRVSGTGLL